MWGWGGFRYTGRGPAPPPWGFGTKKNVAWVGNQNKWGLRDALTTRLGPPAA